MTTGEAIALALSWLATYWLHSTLFLGGAWLLCRARPPRRERDRERVWKLALVGGVLSATLQLALGARPLLGRLELRPGSLAAAATPLASPTQPVELAAEARPEHTVEPISGPARHERTAPGRPATVAQRARPELASRGATRTSAPARMDSPEPDPRPLPRTNGAPAAETASTSATDADTRLGATSRLLAQRWPALVLAAWSAIGLLGVAGLLASWTCLRRRMLGRETLRHGALAERFERLCGRARMSRRVRLTLSDRIPSPFSSGWLWPEVCLPRAVLTDLTPAQQDALLAHELGHLVRRDPAWFGLGFLIERLFFFQPLNRLARRQLCELAEVACDDWAVRWTGARLALASCLTEVAGWVVGEERRLLTPPGLAVYRSRLGQRVARLLDDRRSPSGDPPAPWWPPLAAGALALVALAGPGVSAVRAEALPLPAAAEALMKTAVQPGPLRSAPESLAQDSLPAHTAAASMSAPAVLPLELGVQRGVLASELTLLESELAALHAELEARALRERFEGELARIDARMDALRAQHRRVSELLARVEAAAATRAPPNTPTRAPALVGAPAANESETDENQGDPR